MDIKETGAREIAIEFNAAANELIHLLGSFSAEQLNTIPFEGSWTAAQVAEHLRKGYHGVEKLLYGPAKPAERDPGENIERLKKDFTDFSIKLKSPEFALPQVKDYDKTALIQALTDNREKISAAAGQTGISSIPDGFSFPVYGEMTGMELIYFLTVHTHRHLRQLKNIKEKLEVDLDIL